MNDECTIWARGQRVGNSTTKLLLLCLAYRADALGAVCISQKNMSEETELHVDTLRDRLSTLEERNLIERFKMRRDDGGWTVDMIVLLYNLRARKYAGWVRERAKPVKAWGSTFLTIPFTEANVGLAFMAETRHAP